MSFRGLTPGGVFYNQLIQRNTRPFDLVYTELGNYTEDGAVRLASGAINITIPSGNGDLSGNFQAAGGLLSVSSIEETVALSINDVSITLSAVDSAATSRLLQYPYLDRTTKIWRGLLDDNMEVVGLPLLIFDGNITGASITDDPASGESVVTINCSSQWFDFSRKNGIKTNSASQQKHFPGDLGMEYSASISKGIKWGRE